MRISTKIILILSSVVFVFLVLSSQKSLKGIDQKALLPSVTFHAPNTSFSLIQIKKTPGVDPGTTTLEALTDPLHH